MNKLLSDIISFLQERYPTMVAQLHEFCEINSSSENLAGLAKLHKLVSTTFQPISDTIESRSLPAVPFINMQGQTIMQTCGDLLFIRKRPSLKHRVLLCGHIDTVYSETDPFQTLRYINDQCINGPGVADMKGGLIVMLHALTAFETTPYASKLGWDIIINADEEIGSPASATLFNEITSNYQAALVYEPTMDVIGTLAKNRKGSGKLTIIATGKAAHAGRAFDTGRNAICLLAEAISQIHALNGKRNGVTLNIGKIAGGEALNVVPDKAVAKIDIRITQAEDEIWVRKHLDSIINSLQREGYTLTVHGGFGRPVKKVNSALEHFFASAQHIGYDLGLKLEWQDSGGCCDGNNIAQYGLPVLDTMGVRGGDIHSSNEFILLDSLVERAALSTMILINIASNEKLS